MAHLYHPHYTEVEVSLSWKHSNGTVSRTTHRLNPANTTDRTRESVVGAVTSVIDLIQYIQQGKP
jgi:hypothetical protein